RVGSFFFQAEDGIRDYKVTGVQTCALPISEWLDRAAAVAAAVPTPHRARQMELWRGIARALAGDAIGMRQHLERAAQLGADHGRSEERRVGKEARTRGPPAHAEQSRSHR